MSQDSKLMNHPTSDPSHDGHTNAPIQSCKFESDWLSHMASYKPQSTGSRPHKPSSLASLGLDKSYETFNWSPSKYSKINWLSSVRLTLLSSPSWSNRICNRNFLLCGPGVRKESSLPILGCLKLLPLPSVAKTRDHWSTDHVRECLAIYLSRSQESYEMFLSGEKNPAWPTCSSTRQIESCYEIKLY